MLKIPLLSASDARLVRSQRLCKVSRRRRYHTKLATRCIESDRPELKFGTKTRKTQLESGDSGYLDRFDVHAEAEYII